MVIGADFTAHGQSAVRAGVYLGYRNAQDTRIASAFDSSLQDPYNEGGSSKADKLGNVIVGNYCLPSYSNSRWTGSNYKGYNDQALEGIVVIGDKAGLNASRRSISIGSLANHRVFVNTNSVDLAEIPGFGSVAVGHSSFSGGQESLALGYYARTAYNTDIAIGSGASAKGTYNGKIATAELGGSGLVGSLAVGYSAIAESTQNSS